MHDFTGAKIALLNGNNLVTILNEDKAYIRDANLWDFPGGVRQGNETPKECALREVKSQLGITADAKDILFVRQYDSVFSPGSYAYFMVAAISKDAISAINPTNPGQAWKTMTIEEFLAHPQAVKYCKDRINDYLQALGARSNR